MVEITEKTCFIISQIGGNGSPQRIQADDFLEFIVNACPEIAKFEYNVVRADGIAEPGRITTQVIQHVVEAGLVIADLTGLNANVFYELAIRHAAKKPVIICATEDTALPFDVRDYRAILYSMHARGAKAAARALGQQIQAIHDNDFAIHDPVGEAVQVLTLRNSPKPQDQVLGEILESVRGVKGRIENLERSEAQRYRVNALLDYGAPTGKAGLAALGSNALLRAAQAMTPRLDPRPSSLDEVSTAEASAAAELLATFSKPPPSK